MRILVTGATGFVGGNVARVSQVLGDQVLCAVRRRPPDGFGHPWRLTDLTDADDVRRALDEHQAQAVVHLAIRNDLLDLYQDRRGAPSLLDTLRGLAIEQRIGDVRIAAAMTS
jgi:uncharacterized protein YbjT (DUF2867 family)